MKKSNINFCFLMLFPVIFWPQNIEIIIKDSITGVVIPDVNIQYENLSEGTISNLDGKVKIVGNNAITLSHLSYVTKKITYDNYFKSSIIYLEPGEIVLNEVVVSNYNLKEKLKVVLKNYSKLYVNGERNYQATFKESFRANDSLARLFQVKMKWWNADYELVFEKPWANQNHIQFITTDYKKIAGLEKDFQVSLKNRDFLKSLFLNHYLYFLIFESKDFTVHAIDNQEYITRVVFSVPLEENGVIVRDCENCEVFFDNASGAIVKLTTTLIERPNMALSDDKFKSGKQGTVKITAFTREISFIPYDNKFRLNKFYVKLSADLNVEGVITNIAHENKVYITKVSEVEKILKSKRINLYENSFYEAIPELMSSNPNILLTKEEMNFINQ